MTDPLALPLSFVPVYQSLVWGGRRMATWRDDLPDGPIGESWDLSQQPRGLSLIAEGACRGTSLADLMQRRAIDLLGTCPADGEFPLLVKLIDARDRLSVQVHPDDDLAVEFGVGRMGKTECWYVVGDGGELFQGLRPGIDRRRFEEALALGRLEDCLQRFAPADGDFFFMPARTVHALGAGCLIWEVQQSCDCTFRVHDWGRVGLDGKPRLLHLDQSLATIDFRSGSGGPVEDRFFPHPSGGTVRHLAACEYFSVEERRAGHTEGGGDGRCSIVIVISGHGQLATAAGSIPLRPMRCHLVPAMAGAWSATAAPGDGLRLLVAHPG